MASIFTKFLSKAPCLAKTAIPVVNSTIIRSISVGCKLYSPRVQHPAPDFEGIAVIGDEFKTIKLSDYKGKFVLLVFYPLDFTFVCPTELVALEARYDDFKKLNAEVIGVSIDSHFSHLAWTNTDRKKGGLGKLRYPLLSDINKKVSTDYGVLLENEGIALRGTFLIDTNGTLRVMSINDLPVGRSVDEALRLIEAVKFVDEHGEVCPANWQKGGHTIKPDPKGAKDYFETVNK